MSVDFGKVVVDAARNAGSAVVDTAKSMGSSVASVMPGGERSSITVEQMQELLDVCYEKATNGIPHVSKPIDELVSDYTNKYSNVEDAARAMINMQLAKNTTSGFLSGLAGFLALPVTLAAIPANISNVLYVQMRMVASLAAMGGYDIKSDQVQTMVYVCLTGSAAADLLKGAGIKVAGKFAKGMIEKIPGKALVRINQAVGFRLLTKFGQTGVVNLGKLIPFAGALVGSAFDFGTTKVIAKTAFNHFIEAGANDVIDDETLEVIAMQCETERKCGAQKPSLGNESGVVA